jgi:phosphoglucan,water dikinase
MVCVREKGRVMMQAFANFSHALFAGAFPSPGLLATPSPSGGERDGLRGFPLGEHRVDYSQVRFTSQAELRAKWGARLAQISNFVEREFGLPQDVEGVIRGDEIILVQSRVQQGIPPTT